MALSATLLNITHLCLAPPSRFSLPQTISLTVPDHLSLCFLCCFIKNTYTPQCSIPARVLHPHRETFHPSRPQAPAIFPNRVSYLTPMHQLNTMPHLLYKPPSPVLLNLLQTIPPGSLLHPNSARPNPFLTGHVSAHRLPPPGSLGRCPL